jgi:hypothetical protein
MYFRIEIKQNVINNITKNKTEGLLVVNSGLIAGVLVFLTIGSSDAFFNSEGFQRIAILTSTIVIPFSISAIVILVKNALAIGIKFMTIGFVYLMVSVLIIGFTKL